MLGMGIGLDSGPGTSVLGDFIYSLCQLWAHLPTSEMRERETGHLSGAASFSWPWLSGHLAGTEELCDDLPTSEDHESPPHTGTL